MLARRRQGVAFLAVLGATAVGVFAEGGYATWPRIAFGAAALAAVIVVRPPVRLLREPVVAVLLTLGGLGALSALWTVGLVGEALRWGAVTAGFAFIVLAGAAAGSTQGGQRALAVGLAALAAVAAAMGLISATLSEPTFAVRIAGAWRPGGPLEYPPALALLQVSVLPILLLGMARGSRSAAGAMALAGGVLALSASRTGLALALAVAGAALAWPRPSTPRPVLAAALATGAAAGLVLAAGRRLGEGPLYLAVLVAVVAAAAAGWPALRRRVATRRLDRDMSPAPVLLATAAVAALAGIFAFGPAAGRGAGPATDFLHGRATTWGAGLEAFADRPVLGAGADAFLAASVRYQDGQTILFAHDLPLEAAVELGVPGLVLVLALYGLTAQLLWRRRGTEAAWLFGPAIAAFLVSNLLDWPWHLAGAGAVWAAALGALLVSGRTKS